MHKRLLVILISFFIGMSYVQLAAQTHLSVNMDHPVYTLITQMEARGVLTKLSQMKPYTRYQIRVLLEEIKAKKHLLTEQELTIVERMSEEFAGNFNAEDTSFAGFMQKGRIDVAGWGSTASVGGKIGMFGRINANDTNNPYISAPVNFFVQGDAFCPYVSFKGDITVAFDWLRLSPFIHPGLYRPSGMGFHLEKDDHEVRDVLHYNKLSFGLDMRPELATSFFDGNLLFRTGILDGIHAGYGTMGVVLSKQAVPYPSFEMHFRPTEWMKLYGMVGVLGDFATDWQNEGKVQNQKMISYHNVEFFMNDYLYLSFFEGIVWAKRFELALLNPFCIHMITQNATGDVDNMGFGLSAGLTIPYVGKMWFDLFADEFVLDDWKSPRAEIALQTGIVVPIPWLPLTSLRLQYTKVEPYTYTHYAQHNSTTGLNHDGDRVRTAVTYSNGGKNLGFYLKPNSDEIHLSVNSMPVPGLELTLTYSLIRHGSNLRIKKWAIKNNGKHDKIEDTYNTQADAIAAAHGMAGVEIVPVYEFNPFTINGDINANLDYDVVKRMQRKNFLHDGIYDWTNAIQLFVSYDLSYFRSWLPIKLTVGYEFAYTFLETNGYDKVQNPDGSWNTLAMFKGASGGFKDKYYRDIEDEFWDGFKNIFSLYVSIYY